MRTSEKNYVGESGASYEEFMDIVESSDWYGVDSSNEISIGEYGFLVHETNDSDIYDVVYLNEYENRYKRETVNLRYLAEDIAGHEEFDGFLVCCDIHVENFIEWAVDNPAAFLSDIESYWGFYNWL